MLAFQKSHAIVFLTEQFANYADGRLGDVGTGGGGTIPGWNTPRDQITLTNGTGSLIGTNLGLVDSLGTKVSIAASNIDNTSYNRFVPSGTFPPGTATNIYSSFLYRFNVGTDVPADPIRIIGMNRQNSGWASSNTFSWYLVAKRVGSDVQLGLTRPNGTNILNINYATTNLSAGQTFFVVVRQQIIAGAGGPGSGTNDNIHLWINPPSETFGTNEANIPPPSVSTSEGIDDTSGTGPGRLHIVASGASADVDEMRVANNWAEATPRVGQCLTVGITSDPTNVTQSAEISATFRVVGTGTAPSYQWQISTNGGSTWHDISGAVSASYTTTNLSLATDNGNKYRAIVSVPCDPSSVTSAVATVTLTAPIVTPAGVVMDDTFLDTDVLGFDDRSNPPLTSTNSLWYTAADRSDLLTAFQQGGNMVGTPFPASSSLWLGYFTDTNQPPVHLGLGRTIKVTLPFTPNGFSSFTNNAGLRFGLFDYADGGIRATNDSATLGGSTGNGAGVRGYMLNLDWGTNFSANSPLQLLVRNGIGDINLMGTTGDYISLGSGPAGGGYSNAVAFVAGTQYTLEFKVTRTDVNQIVLSTTITGGGTNWSHSATENDFAYHRFDSFAIRPNSLETSADSFTFPEFIVEVLSGVPISVPPFDITEVRALPPTSIKLTWESVNGATYHVLKRDTISSAEATNATIVATGSTTSYTNSPVSGAEGYYRVMAPPFTP